MITQQGAAFAALCFFMEETMKRTLQQQAVACRAGISVVY